jgi:hypothetical protein
MEQSNIGTTTEMMFQAQAVAESESRAAQAAQGTSVAVVPDLSSPQKADAGQSKFDTAMEAMRKEVSGDNGPTQVDNKVESGTPAPEKVVEKVAEVKQSSESPEVLKERYNNLMSKADKISHQYEVLAMESVKKDANLIHAVAKDNPAVADKIIASELKDAYGISTYQEYVDAMNKGKEAESGKDPVVSKELEEIKKQVESLKQEKVAEHVNSFLGAHKDITKDMGNYMVTLIDKHAFSLEEAYTYAKFKLYGAAGGES